MLLLLSSLYHSRPTNTQREKFCNHRGAHTAFLFSSIHKTTTTQGKRTLERKKERKKERKNNEWTTRGLQMCIGAPPTFSPSMGLLLFLGAQQKKILVSKKNRGRRTQQGKLVCWNVLRGKKKKKRTNKQVKHKLLLYDRGRKRRRRSGGASTLMWHFRRCWASLQEEMTSMVRNSSSAN